MQGKYNPIACRMKAICVAVCFSQTIVLLIFHNRVISSPSSQALTNVEMLRASAYNTFAKSSIPPSSPEASPSTLVKSIPDPDGFDCKLFLQDYRNGKVKEIERYPGGWEKSFVTRTITSKPFYWSLHSPELDAVRSSSYEKGMYYEMELTKLIAQVFDAKNANANTDKESIENEKKESIFLDVGGNIGWFSLLAAAHGATKVYTFEPNPANLVRFCESLALNDWLRDDRGQDRVIPIAKGVGQEAAKLTLWRTDEDNPGSFTFSKRRAEENFKMRNNRGTGQVVEHEYNRSEALTYMEENGALGEIEVITLDSFALSHGWLGNDVRSRPTIDFFKLDVEGYEAQIIYGAEEVFKSRIVENFAMEMKSTTPSEDICGILNILFKSGYELAMHGGWRGPRRLVRIKYKDPKDLCADVSDGKYKENLLFRKLKDWKE